MRISEYEHTHTVVTALLYAFDPDGMGMSVGAPVDEYDGIANQMISAALKSSSPVDEDLVRSHYPASDQFMVSAITSALAIFVGSKP